MSTLEKKITGEYLVAQAEQFVTGLNGKAMASLTDARQAALSQLKQYGFPGPKSEEYKFTRLTKAVSGFDLSKSDAKSDMPLEAIEDIRQKHKGANVLFFINGVYTAEYSDVVSLQNELTIHSLSEIDNISQYLVKNEDAFALQNDVHANSGVIVEVAKGKSLTVPVICYYISIGSDTSAGFSKSIYVANESSKADFIHFHLSIGNGKAYINESKNYIIKANANVGLYKIQEENSQTVYVGNTNVYQEKDSVFSSHIFTFDGALVRNNLTIRVDGEGCESNMYGLYLGKGKTHIDNHTVVDHMKPNCNSNEMYKGILDDQSRGVFNGKIFVRQIAQKTNAFQSNGNILLSDEAIINTKPQLEIWADDVKCSHGCTTGQLNEEAIFYLRARGISKKKARSMILLASVTEVIDKIKLGWLKVEVTDKVIQRLHVD